MSEQLLYAFSAISTMSVIMTAGLLLFVTKGLGSSQRNYYGDNSTMPGPGQPLPLPLAKSAPKWNISWWSGTTSSNTAATSQGMKVMYKKGGVGSDDGIGFRAEPFRKLPATQCVFSLSMYIPGDHQWGGKVHGAKIPPGVCFGTKPGDCASGGTYEKTQGSVRCMWREDGKLVAYVYLPGISDEDTLKRQGPQFKRAAHVTGSGIDLWRKVDTFSLKKGAWNSIYLKITLNTPGKNNGIIELALNGQVRRVSDVNFRSTNDIKIQHAFVSSFYGGGSDYAPTQDTYILLKDFGFDSS
jgi:hypothetical protein